MRKGAKVGATNRKVMQVKLSWPQRISKLREARGDRCEFGSAIIPTKKPVTIAGRRCKATANLEFAHIIPTGLSGRGRGQTQRYRDIEKNPECYMLVCKKHHGMIGDPADRTKKEKETEGEFKCPF